VKIWTWETRVEKAVVDVTAQISEKGVGQMVMEDVTERSTDDSFALNDDDDIVKFTRNEQNESAEHIYVGALHSVPGPLITMESNIEVLNPTSCTIEDINTETTGRSMRKRSKGHVVDKLQLNSCLCGSIVDPSMEGVEHPVRHNG
jgi:hypothetical protein